MNDINQRQASKAKIRVAPPVPCFFAGVGGELVEIDIGMFVVKFSGVSRPAPAAGPLQVGLTSFLDQSIIAQPEESRGDLWTFSPRSPEDARALTNLLTVLRKEQHIKLCAEEDVESSNHSTGFELFHLKPRTLPELAWDDLDTTATLLGQQFALPFLITGMTGGVEQGAEINRRLALAAQAFSIPMGVGSQRLALADPKYCEIFRVKQHAPNVFLIGNLGINQLKKGQEVSDCIRAIDMIEANAMAIHVNVLQELIQEEGDRDFRRLLDRIAAIAGRLDVPVIVKEVGSGMDEDTALALWERGIRCLDVGGQGGTSWAYIEGLRSNDPGTLSLGRVFRDWGIPTATSLKIVRRRLPTIDIIATGGLRDGLAAAKAVALGATTVGFGLPLFRAAVASEEGPTRCLETMMRGLKTAMICSGSQSLGDLGSRITTERMRTNQLTDDEP